MIDLAEADMLLARWLATEMAERMPPTVRAEFVMLAAGQHPTPKQVRRFTKLVKQYGARSRALRH